ncbi:MAG: aminodeoxychorismate lyase [Bacillota bacterium]|nr:aminodeoxychorismate lyase [Bacillota bacterium]
MRINLLSSFAAGILIATVICAAAYFSEPKVKTVYAELSENEMAAQLESKGYIVQTKDNYEKNLKNAKPTAEKQDSPKDNSTTKGVTKVVINVSDGMTSIDVGKALVTAKIIPNAFKFSQDVQKKGVENNLRPGVFVVDSEMSYDQVISTIFKK